MRFFLRDPSQVDLRPYREEQHFWCLPKGELIDGHYYFGWCRNARIARWDAASNRFYYWRRKFTFEFVEAICYPTDDDAFDVFVPALDVEWCKHELRAIAPLLPTST